MSPEVLDRAAALLKVLAHPHRLRIVELLSQRAMPVGELAVELRIAPHACSQHLDLMKAHGLLTRRRCGRMVYYLVAEPTALKVIDCVREHHL